MPDLSHLSQFNDAYDKAPAGLNDLPPDGDYQAVVDRFDIFEAKSNNRLYLKTEMTVALGDYKGWSVDTIHSLDDPDRMSWLKKHLTTLEVDCHDLSKLEDCLVTALDAPVLVAVKTKGEYRNVYVNQRLGTPLRAASDLESATSDIDNNPLPF